MIASAETTVHCPACDQANGLELLHIEQVPVYCNELHRDRLSAQSAPRGDLCLHACLRCGLVFNAAFDPQRIDYRVEYENSLHFSPRFREFQEGLAARLVERYQLHGKLVVEIGCGDGAFLKSLCTRGANRGIGYEPAAAASRSLLDEPPVEIINDYFSPADIQPDLICSRHVLEHIVRPLGMLQSVIEIATGQGELRVYFEVPNAEQTLTGTGVWDLLYEHCLYFTQSSLRRLFETAGFEVVACETSYGGQFLGIEAVGHCVPPRNRNFANGVDHDWRDHLLDFQSCYQQELSTWDTRLKSLRAAGQTVVAWGAGTKGTMFLNTIPEADLVSAIVDINPRKQHGFVAGTGAPIVPPEELCQLRPDVVILMNPIYREEVADQLRQLGCSAEILVA